MEDPPLVEELQNDNTVSTKPTKSNKSTSQPTAYPSVYRRHLEYMGRHLSQEQQDAALAADYDMVLKLNKIMKRDNDRMKAKLETHTADRVTELQNENTDQARRLHEMEKEMRLLKKLLADREAAIQKQKEAEENRPSLVNHLRMELRTLQMKQEDAAKQNLVLLKRVNRAELKAKAYVLISHHLFLFSPLHISLSPLLYPSLSTFLSFSLLYY